jgi:hypothetical protein
MERPSCYRSGLIDAIRIHFPWQFFARWKLPCGLRWTPQRLFWMALLMTWSPEQTLGERFTAVRELLRALFPRWRLGTTYTGWYEAQARWLAPLQPELARRLRQQLRALGPAVWTREGWCAFAADGSRVECPRTAANEQGLGCAGRKKTGPQLFLTTLWHLGTGLPWDFRIGPGTASERRHVEEMLADLPAAALLVADAGFTGYDFYRRIEGSGRAFLLRVGANVRLLSRLGYWEREGADTVYLWPENKRAQPPVVLRLVVLGRGKQRLDLVTNVLDSKALSRQTAALLYEMRWGVEVFYRTTKQTLQKRKMLSRTPAAARCELTWAVLGVWLLGLLSVAAILARGGGPLSWSAALARRRVRESMRQALADRPSGPQLVEQLGKATKDDYTRATEKKARDWPHKKKDKPPGNPKIVVAKAKEIRSAKKVMGRKKAA